MMGSKRNGDERGSLLLADPEAITQSVSAAELQAAGFEVLVAHTGMQAAHMVETKLERGGKLSVVLVDVRMPEISGFELVRRLSVHRGKRRVPIILMSKYLCADDESEGYNAGADGVLKKPVCVAELADIMERYRLRQLKMEIAELVMRKVDR